MKRHAIVLCVAVLLFAAIVVFSFGQDNVHVVSPDENLWNITGVYTGDPVRWIEFQRLNPFLSESGRIYRDQQDRIIAVIKPGEELEDSG